MARKCNKNPSVKFQITTTSQVYRHLENLVDTGLYGATVPEAGNQLICESLRGYLKKNRAEVLTKRKRRR